MPWWCVRLTPGPPSYRTATMNKDDSWIIIGPGRTGSKVIVDTLMSAYRHFRWPLTYIAPGNCITAKPGHLLHSHNLEDLELGYTNRVFSIRNCVESAISWCVQPHIGEWHLYHHKHKEKLGRISPFVIDPALVLQQYTAIRRFYSTAQSKINSNSIIIDYTDFRDNNYTLLEKLNLDRSITLSRMPVKNPGTYSDWILNWDEVHCAVKDLSIRPF